MHFIVQQTIQSHRHIYVYPYRYNQCVDTVDKKCCRRGGEDEMYKTNFIQRLWRECILIINYIKVNKKYPLEKKYMYK